MGEKDVDVRQCDAQACEVSPLDRALREFGRAKYEFDELKRMADSAYQVAFDIGTRKSAAKKMLAEAQENLHQVLKASGRSH